MYFQLEQMCISCVEIGLELIRINYKILVITFKAIRVLAPGSRAFTTAIR